MRPAVTFLTGFVVWYSRATGICPGTSAFSNTCQGGLVAQR